MRRLYVFVNMYLEGIRAGVQALHAAVRLTAEHGDVTQDETVLVFQAGDEDNLLRLASEFYHLGCPGAIFEEPGLGHCLTAVAAVFDRETLPDGLRLEIDSMRLCA